MGRNRNTTINSAIEMLEQWKCKDKRKKWVRRRSKHWQKIIDAMKKDMKPIKICVDARLQFISKEMKGK